MSEPEIKYDAHKIVLLGIENAGKTSIIKTLTHEFDEIAKLKPTVSVQRTFMEVLGKQLSIWDFGGQESYRDKYLTQPERYFDAISHVFYVLDIQDPTMLGSNIMYFQGVFRRLKKFSPKAKFVLLFHKLDPDLKVPQNALQLQKEFLESCPESADIQYYHTSIFNPLSIVKAITFTLFEKRDLNENISKILTSFCERYNLLFASLVAENFIEVGYYVKPEFLEKNSPLIDRIFRHFYLNFKQWLNPETPIYAQSIPQSNVSIISHLYLIDSLKMRVPFYFVVGYDQSKTLDDEQLKKEVTLLNENLTKILSVIDLSTLFK
jgi:small GTP-binding protein